MGLIIFRSVKARPNHGTNDGARNPDTQEDEEYFRATINAESIEQENGQKESGQKSEGESAARPTSSSRNHRNPHTGARTGGSRQSGLVFLAADWWSLLRGRCSERVFHDCR